LLVRAEYSLIDEKTMVKLGLIVICVLSSLTFAFAFMVRSEAAEVNPVVPAGETRSTNGDTDQTKNQRLQSTANLCGSIDVDEFHRLRDRLDAGVSDKAELSRIDAEVAAARHDCRTPTIAAYLMNLLAVNWKVQGDLDRADRLFQEAYASLDGDPTDPILDRIAILDDWATFKLAAGEPDRAIEIAKLQTAEARKERERETSSDRFSTDILIDALKFQARIFEKVGLAGEARAARQEAEQLAAQQKPCSGVCAFTHRKIN
jgi:hypothetical protein